MGATIRASPTHIAHAMTGGIIATAVHRTISWALVLVLRAINAVITSVTQAHVVRGAVTVTRAVIGAGLEWNIATRTSPAWEAITLARVGTPAIVTAILRAFNHLRAVFASELTVALASSVEIAPAIAGTVARTRHALHTAIVTEPTVVA